MNWTFTTREAIFFVAMINAAVGLVLGLVPLGFGYFKGRLRTGILGILCTTLGGAIFGIIGSVTMAVLFTWLAVREKKPAQPALEESEPENAAPPSESTAPHSPTSSGTFTQGSASNEK